MIFAKATMVILMSWVSFGWANDPLPQERKLPKEIKIIKLKGSGTHRVGADKDDFIYGFSVSIFMDKNSQSTISSMSLSNAEKVLVVGRPTFTKPASWRADGAEFDGYDEFNLMSPPKLVDSIHFSPNPAELPRWDGSYVLKLSFSNDTEFQFPIKLLNIVPRDFPASVRPEPGETVAAQGNRVWWQAVPSSLFDFQGEKLETFLRIRDRNIENFYISRHFEMNGVNSFYPQLAPDVLDNLILVKTQESQPIPEDPRVLVVREAARSSHFKVQ